MHAFEFIGRIDWRSLIKNDKVKTNKKHAWINESQ